MAYSHKSLPHESHSQHRSITRLPPIPDLRFESTFLRNIQPYVHLPSDPTSEEHGNLTAQPKEARIEWVNVSWVIIRDVALSPLMWGTASAFAQPLLRMLYASAGRSRDSLARSVHVIHEGSGAAWLRGWASKLLGSVQQGVTASNIHLTGAR